MKIKNPNKKHKTWTQILGRFQPLHDGHKALINKVLEDGDNIIIMLRKEDGNKEKNPYTQKERFKMFTEAYPEETKTGRIIIASVPDITRIAYGRGVGYSIDEIELPKEIQKISATEIRKKNKENKSDG